MYIRLSASTQNMTYFYKSWYNKYKLNFVKKFGFGVVCSFQGPLYLRVFSCLSFESFDRLGWYVMHDTWVLLLWQNLLWAFECWKLYKWSCCLTEEFKSMFEDIVRNIRYTFPCCIWWMSADVMEECVSCIRSVEEKAKQESK
jgi:hypothetical protein